MSAHDVVAVLTLTMRPGITPIYNAESIARCNHNGLFLAPVSFCAKLIEVYQ
ncbi:hypothetical protein EBL_c01640 [Shimwellia blattae DSM 4481 = NBRC 105725]|uniref:Uncharacterized protein n=1 Tax=Shimwellia blattae (strain ATCC 29907 / DSM 4481 / JCM 1650 / NBRC 105725 / CDC 9005-74) TaxID=630626 RepID=I2B445_SHIBC|nr:hypothetical protein EBL_c01640 [Shimwellia blattae DSM 4481 = NBRC 105725]